MKLLGRKLSGGADTVKAIYREAPEEGSEESGSLRARVRPVRRSVLPGASAAMASESELRAWDAVLEEAKDALMVAKKSRRTVVAYPLDDFSELLAAASEMRGRLRGGSRRVAGGSGSVCRRGGGGGGARGCSRPALLPARGVPLPPHAGAHLLHNSP
jgi:hypothetical protein